MFFSLTCFYVYAHTLLHVFIFISILFDMFLCLYSYTSIYFYIIFVHFDMFLQHQYLNG